MRTIGVYDIAYLLLTTFSVTGKNAEGSGRGLLYHVTSCYIKRQILKQTASDCSKQDIICGMSRSLDWWLTTLRVISLVPSSSVKQYRTLRNIPEERKAYLHRGRILE
jgi:hypothetical protein